MELHKELKYKNIEDVNKITVRDDMLIQIERYFSLNQVPNCIDYNFKRLNIEILSHRKMNIYIENQDESHATITFFRNEVKLVSFVIEYVFDIGFDVEYILEYDDILKYKENAEELILFALKWYPMILFYVQDHSCDSDTKMKKHTFFINTKILN